MSKKVLCEHCLEETNYSISEEEIITKIKGITVKFQGKRSYCETCHKIVFVNDILEYNKQKCYNIFTNENPNHKPILVWNVMPNVKKQTIRTPYSRI